MEFTCLQKDLHQGVQSVEKIVLTRSTLPIIGNILIETKKDSLRLSANNLEMGMQVEIPAKVRIEGAGLVPAKTLANIVSHLPQEEISFKKLDKGNIQISYRESNFSINVLPPDEFPALPKIKEGELLTINAALLAQMVEYTIIATSASEDQQVLNGALLEIGPEAGASKGSESNIRMVATDGYRLARFGGCLPKTPKKTSKVIVPAKTLAEIGRILSSGNGEEVKVTISSDQIAVECDKTYLVSMVIQGEFPDYKRVIPKRTGVKINLDTANFLQAAERAAIIAGGNANIIQIELKNKKLHVQAMAPDVGSIDEVIEVDAPGASRIKIAFNVRLLMDALKIIETQTVSLEISEPLSPGILRPNEGSDYLYIVMPIRTAEHG